MRDKDEIDKELENIFQWLIALGCLSLVILLVGFVSLRF